MCVIQQCVWRVCVLELRIAGQKAVPVRAGAGGCGTLCFHARRVINHLRSGTSANNNARRLPRGGRRTIAFLYTPAKLKVNGRSQTWLPHPPTVSSFSYLSISARYSPLSQEAADCAVLGGSEDQICCSAFLALIVCL